MTPQTMEDTLMRALLAIGVVVLFVAGVYGVFVALTTDNREVPPEIVMTQKAPWQK